MRSYHTNKRWLLLVEWIILSITAILFGFLVLRFPFAPSGGKGNIITDLLAGLVLFGFLPLAQWIVIRQLIPRAYRWIIASLLAFIVAFLLDLLLTILGIPTFTQGSSILLSFILGCIIGISQWTILRQYFQKAGWWIAASAIGWGLSTVVTGYVIEIPLEYLAIGAIPATVTGIALIFIIPESQGRSSTAGQVAT